MCWAQFDGTDLELPACSRNEWNRSGMIPSHRVERNREHVPTVNSDVAHPLHTIVCR